MVSVRLSVRPGADLDFRTSTNGQDQVLKSRSLDGRGGWRRRMTAATILFRQCRGRQGRAARQKDLGNFRIWFSGHGFQDLGSQLWGLDFHTRGFQDRNLKTFRTWFSGCGISVLGPGFRTVGFTVAFGHGHPLVNWMPTCSKYLFNNHKLASHKITETFMWTPNSIQDIECVGNKNKRKH